MNTQIPAVLDGATLLHDEPSGRRGRVPLRQFAFAGLIACVVALFLLELMIGPVRVPLQATLATLLGRAVERASWVTIIWTLRLPRAITAMIAGAALAAAGLQMQTVFRNPLAGKEPGADLKKEVDALIASFSDGQAG